MHQRWAQAIEATMRAHLAINDRIGSAARAALEAESLALTDRIAKLVTAVTPYQSFVASAMGRVRASQGLLGASRGATFGLARKAAARLAALPERRGEVLALREFLAQMNDRLRGYFPQSFIDSLYPDFGSKDRALAESEPAAGTGASSSVA